MIALRAAMWSLLAAAISLSIVVGLALAWGPL